MNYFDTFIFSCEIISIVSFGISGAVTAIKKGMDVFGAVTLGVVTSIGGGVIRDMILGIHPPKTFMRPVYAIVAALSALITFIIEAHHFYKYKNIDLPHTGRFTDEVLFWLDTVGLAVFTMVGIAVAYEQSSDYNAFVLCFVGVITGVGGGVMRDTFTLQLPYIFVKHIYASACIVGSIVCILLWNIAGRYIAMLSGMAVVILLRYLARRYKWNLPRLVKRDDD